MNRRQAIIFSVFIQALIISGVLMVSCKGKSAEGLILFTQVSSGAQEQIAALEPGRSGGHPQVITDGFYSAKSPAITSDGTKMVFSARKNKDDAWAIWEMDLNGFKSRKIISFEENCYDPAFLPTGRIIFSRQEVKDNPESGRAVISCNSDGTDVRKVTFNPYCYSGLTILKDGRLLAVSSELSPDRHDAILMVMRPDGTKNQLFYEGAEGSGIKSRVWETDNGRLVFVESENDKSEKGNIVSISYNRPLHSFSDLSAGIEGSFSTVYPLRNGKFLVSFRKPGSERYGLYEFDPKNRTIGSTIYETTDVDITDVVVSEKHNRAKKLPSEVDMGVKTGLLLCQNINFNEKPGLQGKTQSHASKIRIVGKDSCLGEFEVEKDGSFYLKVMADTPFKIQKIDDNGNLLGKSCEWVYLRPNERRGCVGCHEDPEQVPENMIPLAVKKQPVGIPAHIHKVLEKKVSLE